MKNSTPPIFLNIITNQSYKMRWIKIKVKKHFVKYWGMQYNVLFDVGLVN